MGEDRVQFGSYSIRERLEIPGDGFDALAEDPTTGKEIRLWVGAVLPAGAPDPLPALDELKGRLARIYHASLPRVLGAEVVEDRPVLKVQPYSGRLLAEEISGNRRTVPESLDLSRGIGAALVKAHAAGVYHGAVTENEILLTDEGRPLLLHLGFGPFLGRRPVRAPEDLDLPGGSESGDVFGLSRILAHLLLGEDPYAASPAAAPADAPAGDVPASAQAAGPAPDPAEAAQVFVARPARTADEFPPEYPEGLRRFLARALRPDRAVRIHRAEEFAGDLGVIRASWGDFASPPPAPALPILALLRPRTLGFLGLAAAIGALIAWKGCVG